jgi:hypothetical protein
MSETVRREKRLVLRVLAQWREMRDDRRFPSIDDVKAEAFVSDWPHCFLVELPADGSTPRFLYVGAQLEEEIGRPMAGLPITDCPPDTLLAAALAPHAEAVSRAVPLSVGGEMASRAGPILYRSIVLPLSGDDERIDHLLGAANSRLVVKDGD